MTRHEMTCRAGTRLSNISDWICKLTPNQGTCEVILTVEQARKLWGYGQQIGIEADRLLLKRLDYRDQEPINEETV